MSISGKDAVSNDGDPDGHDCGIQVFDKEIF
jgi:hypothetical protein